MRLSCFLVIVAARAASPSDGQKRIMTLTVATGRAVIMMMRRISAAFTIIDHFVAMSMDFMRRSWQTRCRMKNMSRKIARRVGHCAEP